MQVIENTWLCANFNTAKMYKSVIIYFKVGNMAIEILVKAEDGTVNQLAIKKERVTIGRSKKCTLQLNDAMMSGSHCAFFIQDNHLVFKDLGSTNGSFINNVKMTDARIYLGDIVRIGRTEISIAESKLNSKERTQHTRDTPKTQITFIKFQETKTGHSGIANSVLSKSDIYQSDDPYNDPNSLLNKQATTIFQVEKRKTEIEKLKKKKQKEEEKLKNKKGIFEKLFGKKKKN